MPSGLKFTKQILPDSPYGTSLVHEAIPREEKQIIDTIWVKIVETGMTGAFFQINTSLLPVWQGLLRDASCSNKWHLVCLS